MNFRGYYAVDGEVYHIEPQVIGRHFVYRDSDSVLPAGKCGKLNDVSWSGKTPYYWWLVFQLQNYCWLL